MNWKIILLLSLLGVAVGFAGIFGISGGSEMAAWLLVYLVFAIVIARRIDGDYFIHALLASMLAGLWVGIIHAAFLKTYVEHNAHLRAGFAAMPRSAHPRLTMIFMGPFIGAVMGIVAGVMAAVAGKLLKKGKDPTP